MLNRAWSPSCDDVGNAKRKERGALWYILSYYGYGIDQKISILWSQLTMCNPFDLLSTSMLKAVQFILKKENQKRIKKTDQKCGAYKYEYTYSVKIHNFDIFGLEWPPRSYLTPFIKTASMCSKEVHNQLIKLQNKKRQNFRLFGLEWPRRSELRSKPLTVSSGGFDF